ncbi:MAG: CDP-alcohol phosphatidyltransferase family protein [Patescibacteria group bacterium]
MVKYSMGTLPSIKELKATIQPDPKKETVWYAKYVIRKVSIYFTWILLHTPLTANQATLIQAFFGIAGSILLAFGGYKWSVPALILIQLGYIFDCVDGEIARYRKKPSVNGIFLDSLNHALVIPFIFLGLVIFSYYLVNETWVLFVGLILVIFSGNPVKKGMLSTLFYMLERKDNPKYQIANMVQDNGLQPASQNPQPEISTIRSKMSLKNIIIAAAKDISEYPTSMNIITVTVITDVLMQKHGNWEYYPLSLLLVIFYTVFLVFKEIFFLHKIYSNRVVEKKFMNYIK